MQQKDAYMRQAALISKLLRASRKSRKWTQTELALSSGVHQSQISRFLNGKFARVTKNVRKVCKYAQVEIREIADSGALPNGIVRALHDILNGTKEREKAMISLLKAEARLLRNDEFRD